MILNKEMKKENQVSLANAFFIKIFVVNCNVIWAEKFKNKNQSYYHIFRPKQLKSYFSYKILILARLVNLLHNQKYKNN